MKNNEELINHIRDKSRMYLDTILRSEKVLQAMLRVDRIDFLPFTARRFAYMDRPLPIGHNQTCSQPSMVAFMLDKLEIKPGHKVLEIGSGCGYAAAIASQLCLPDGFVYASEIIPKLAEFARNNLAQYMENIEIIAADGSAGFAEYAPFDRIFISAGVTGNTFDSSLLLDQLNEGGILLYPESYGNIYKLKKVHNTIEKETYYGVSFVPLRGKNA